MRRKFLIAAIVSISLAALLGVWAVVSGDFGWLELRVLLTTFTVGGASVCGMGCGMALDSGRGVRWGWFGLWGTGLAALMTIGGIWAEPHGDLYWRVTAVIACATFPFVYTALTAQARLSAGSVWVRWVAVGLSIAVAAILIGMIVTDDSNEAVLRLLAALGILLAALSVVLPVLHRLQREADDVPASRGSRPSARGSRVDVLAALDAEIEDLEGRLEELRARRAELTSSP